MRDKTKYASVIKKCQDLLVDNKDAYNFVLAYGDYIECIDDLVDETKNIELINKTTNLSAMLFSSNYWTVNNASLVLVEQMIHVIYFNSVAWENSGIKWKMRDAKALSHIGYGMLFAILLLETRDVPLVQSIALEFMEKAHSEHYDDMPLEIANS